MSIARLLPVGDQSYLAYFDREQDALRYASTILRDNPAWLVDVIQAYSSVGMFFDPQLISSAEIEPYLRSVDPTQAASTASGTVLHRIPCCYELGLDLGRVSHYTGLDQEAIISLHVQAPYTVWAIGFCPGFPYLGYLPAMLQGVPRLESPRIRVEAGSVGLTGRQTGIYTEPRPGGWNLIGRTPLELVCVADEYFPIRTGDQVQFYRVDEAAYRQLLAERLPSGR